MRRFLVKGMSALLIAVAVLGFTTGFWTLAVEPPEPSAVVYVDPAMKTFMGPIGSTFSVNVTVANITGLYGSQFRLTWDPTLLSCQGIREVFFHTVTPSSDWSNIQYYLFNRNNTGGYADYAVAWLDRYLAVAHGYASVNVTTTSFPPEGKVALATFIMRVEKAPPFRGSVSCDLGLSGVIACTIDAEEIPVSSMNGTFTLNWSPPVTTPFFSVSPPRCTATTAGEVFNVSVLVNNLDMAWQATGFEFKLGYNASLLNVQQVYEGSWLPSFGIAPNGGTLFSVVEDTDFVQVSDTLQPDVNGTWYAPFPYGNGTVATIQFNATMQGNFPAVLGVSLHLYDTLISDWNQTTIEEAQPEDLNWSPPVTTPFFSVSPPSYTATALGEVFNVSVQVNNLDIGWQATGFEFKLGYNASLLNVQQVYGGSWLPPFGTAPNGGTSFSVFEGSDFVQVGETLQSDFNGTWYSPFPYGSGIVATIQFNATMQGKFPSYLSCPLHLYDMLISDWNQTTIEEAQSQDGTYSISSWNLGVHNVIVTNVTADRSWVYQGHGFIVTINMTVLNKGDFDEIVRIFLYYDTTESGGSIGRTYLIVLPGQNDTATFRWDTWYAPFCYSGYNITARIELLGHPSYDTLFVSQLSIQVRIPGDINADRRVDLLDAIQLGNHYGLREGDAAWNPDADLNLDGKVNILDVIIAANHFGESSLS